MNIIQLKEKVEEKKHIEKSLQEVQAELIFEEKRILELEINLNKEYKDVQGLENGNLSSFFYEMLGTKEKKLDKERQEYVAAQLKFESCEKGISDLKTELEKLKSKLVMCGTPDVQYKQQLDLKKAGLKTLNDSQFLKYEDLLQAFFSQKKEVKEAIAAGEMALKGLSFAIKALGNAQSWGTVDMIGGGLLTTAIKHSKMDEARGLIQDVQYWLRKFNRELKDVKVSGTGTMELELDGLTTFADYFFDNLITDWIVQSKINRSREGCQNVYLKVKQILKQLKHTDQYLTSKYKSTSKEFTNYIENS